MRWWHTTTSKHIGETKFSLECMNHTLNQDGHQ
jgi:hypothetical protein